MDPDFDPGEPWGGGLVAGVAIVMLGSQLLLGIVSLVHQILQNHGG